jgi:hypothetical protein
MHDAGWFAEALLLIIGRAPPKKTLVTGTSRLEKKLARQGLTPPEGYSNLGFRLY